jgi:hypothetical protein
LEAIVQNTKISWWSSNKLRIRIIIVFIIGTGLITILYRNLEPNSKTVVNFFTLYGTFATLFGLWLTYIQIKTIRETNYYTTKEVRKSLDRINQVLSVSDLSRANKIIQEIQSSILNNKVELALLRAKDLKSILIQVKYNEQLTEFTQSEIYNQNITDLGTDIINMNDFVLQGKKGVSFSKINKNLENLATVLTDFENKLKNSKI